MHIIGWITMKTQQQFFIALLLAIGILLQYHVTQAQPLLDRPVPEFDYIQEVGEGQFVFVMLSIEDDPSYGVGTAVQDENIRRQYSQSGLYRNDGSIKPVWTVDWYAFQVTISLDGKYLVRWGPWPSSENYDELAIAFYKNGREMRRYAVKDLVAAPESLPHTVSHYFWEKDTSFDPTTNVLHLETENGEEYDFDITTGRKLTDPVLSFSNVVQIAVVGVLFFGGAFVLLRRLRTADRTLSKPAA